MVPMGHTSKRDRILAVMEGCLGERGYNGTRLHQIAERVGIQKASLFHYFASKEELYRAALERGFGETESLVRSILDSDETPERKLRRLVEAYVELVALHSERARILIRHSLGDAPKNVPVPDTEPVLAELVEFIRAGQREGVFAPIDPLTLVLGFVGMVGFLFTSAPVLAPKRFAGPTSPATVAFVRSQMVQIAERCLLHDSDRNAATPPMAAVGP